MTSNELVLAMLVHEAACDLIGGLENTMMDYPEDSEEYKDAKHDLEMGHDTLVTWVVNEVKRNREAMKHLKFVGNDFIVTRANKVVTKLGY